jgi:hypothetical protein
MRINHIGKQAYVIKSAVAEKYAVFLIDYWLVKRAQVQGATYIHLSEYRR